ncbi:MAG: ABC transporter ATP-binding protein [Microthrixaceae bacterium]
MQTATHTHPYTAEPAPVVGQIHPTVERALVSARNIGRVWGKGDGATVALDGVDLSARRGELLAIVGPSGSGKSTLGGILAGIDRPDSGAVTVDGVRIDQLRREKLAQWRAHNVGIVFQEPHLMGVLSAQENVEVALQLAGVRRGRRQRARNALTAVGLEGSEHKLPSQLSGGERQRVGIARALVARPSFVVADEPTGALDQANGHAVFGLLRHLADAGTAVVVITHALGLAAESDRTVTLVDGRISEGHSTETGALR